MASVLTSTFKAGYGILYFGMFIYILLNIDTETLFDLSKLVLLLDYLIAFFTIIFATLGSLIVQLVFTFTSAISIGTIRIPFTNIVILNLNFSDPESANALATNNAINNLLTSILPQSSVLTSDLINDPNVIITDFINVWGIAVAFVLLPIILLSAFGFLIRGESRLAITSFISLQVLFILSMYLPNLSSPTGRMNLINLDFPAFGGTVDSFINDFTTLLFSPIFQIGILLYLVLELGFQASYAISVVDPMIDRERRIKEHLKRIDLFQPKAEKDKKTSYGGMKGTTKKYDVLAASYLREMVDRKLFKRGQEQDQKTTMRLQSYIASLRRIDRKFEFNITAKSAQPNPMSLLRNAIPLITIRVLLVIFFAFLIINPNAIVNLLISNPSTGTTGILSFPQLADSIELTQPEFRTVILFNIILTILAFSALVHWLLVHKPEVPERAIQKVDTLVDFTEIAEAENILDEDEDEEEEN